MRFRDDDGGRDGGMTMGVMSVVVVMVMVIVTVIIMRMMAFRVCRVRRDDGRGCVGGRLIIL